VLQKKDRLYRRESLVQNGIKEMFFFLKKNSLNQFNLSLVTVVTLVSVPCGGDAKRIRRTTAEESRGRGRRIGILAHRPVRVCDEVKELQERGTPCALQLAWNM
jgi:hypothetical protein